MAVEITEDFVWQVIPPRPRESHKGHLWHCSGCCGQCVLPWCGPACRRGSSAHRCGHRDPCQCGASARCCRSPPAGVLSVPVRRRADGGISPESIPFIQRQKATVLLLGPGLGGTAQSAARAAETRVLVQRLLPSFAGSAVLDADGLNAAAQLFG